MIATLAATDGGTLHDLELYVIFPLIVAGVMGLAGFLTWIAKRINEHGTALAVLTGEVRPEGERSLSSRLSAIELDVAVVKSRTAPPAPRGRV